MTRGHALRALRRLPSASDAFPQDVLELQSYFEKALPGQRVVAAPADGTEVPLTILGSSLFGASLAAEFGLPFVFASHFAPDLLLQALKIYRERFKPSQQLAKPFVGVGVNVIAADTDQQAQYLATSQLKFFSDFLRNGNGGPIEPPVDDIEVYWSPAVKLQAQSMLRRSVVGSPRTVGDGLRSLMEETSADELVVVTDVFDKQARHHSFEIVAAELIR